MDGGTGADARADSESSADGGNESPDGALRPDASGDAGACTERWTVAEPASGSARGYAELEMSAAARSRPVFSTDGTSVYALAFSDHRFDQALMYVSAFRLEADGTLSNGGVVAQDSFGEVPLLIAPPDRTRFAEGPFAFTGFDPTFSTIDEWPISAAQFELTPGMLSLSNPLASTTRTGTADSLLPASTVISSDGSTLMTLHAAAATDVGDDGLMSGLALRLERRNLDDGLAPASSVALPTDFGIPGTPVFFRDDVRIALSTSGEPIVLALGTNIGVESVVSHLLVARPDRDPDSFVEVASCDGNLGSFGHLDIAPLGAVIDGVQYAVALIGCPNGAQVLAFVSLDAGEPNVTVRLPESALGTRLDAVPQVAVLADGIAVAAAVSPDGEDRVGVRVFPRTTSIVETSGGALVDAPGIEGTDAPVMLELLSTGTELLTYYQAPNPDSVGGSHQRLTRLRRTDCP